MDLEDLFVRIWRLIFPLLGFVWPFVELAQSGGRSKRAMDLIQTYVEQGKEPPPEHLDIAAGGKRGERASVEPILEPRVPCRLSESERRSLRHHEAKIHEHRIRSSEGNSRILGTLTDQPCAA
jgi:hypothetical protein